MAKIIPFGDINAHGTISKIYNFRRSRFGIVFQKKPTPKQPRTIEQLEAWTNFKNAVNKWNYLTDITKQFYTRRGKELNIYGINLYTKAVITGKEPSQTREKIKTCRNIILYKLYGSTPLHLEYKILSETGIIMGNIYDNQNIYYQGGGSIYGEFYALAINNYENEITIDWRQLITITIEYPDNTQKTLNIRLPEITLNQNEGILLYPSIDGSLYKEDNMRDLLCTDII